MTYTGKYGAALLSAEELEAELRQVGHHRYHIHHPFHRLMVDGKLTKGQLQAWALNRYCYQSAIPRKDAIILSRSDDRQFRATWRERLVDHDGEEGGEGGIERWIKLATGLGLDEIEVASGDYALPVTHFAVGAYLELVSKCSLLEAVASSLTEMFSPAIITERVSAMLAKYDYVDEQVLAYFKPRLTQAPRDANFALNYVVLHADTQQKQRAAVQALKLKCNILWTMLDGLYYSYVAPGFVPPGAFIATDQPDGPSQ